jgi:hypothetical protein
MKLLNEEISRIKSMMGLINESNISLPIIVRGSYSAKGQKNPGDALHSFEKRKSDGFGGRMSSIIKKKLKEVYELGINPDVTNITINVDSTNLGVNWSATINESNDGKAYVGVSTVGSAGGDADRRALQQIEKLKNWVKGAKDYKLVLDFTNPSGIYIRQYFYKYTVPGKYPPYTSTGQKNYDKTEDPVEIETNGIVMDSIKTLQQDLIEKGYDLGEYGANEDGIDGIAGPLTKIAYKEEFGKEFDPTDFV